MEPVTPTYALVAGGGTAGHIIPGLAVAAALVARGHEPASLVFVGSERGLENQLVPEAGYPLVALPGRGIQRRFTWENVDAILGILRGVIKGIGLVRRLRPKVVLVVGGYASVACTVGAVLSRVPIVVTEQNARAGAANRLAGLFAKAAAVPFPDTDLPRKVVAGNPVRPEILTIDRVRDRDAARAALGLPSGRTVIAVFSGSLGSRTINDAVRGLLPLWRDRDDVVIRHVIGTRDWGELGGPPELPEDGLLYQPVRYENHMELMLAAADLAVTRAGGNTVAELAVAGLPAVLVPLPIAPRDHQTANAAVLMRAGAAILVPDVEMNAARLAEELEPLLAEPARLAAMSEAVRSVAYRDAADRVARLVEEHARA
jgi:UDP-N-acetylglucosamine--N-acetylmuramyl-(pentapeptide) pyrophosphoryl-undecaprenol N-acetylglucosamine transferase